MENKSYNDIKFENYCEIIKCANMPEQRFGHTVNWISKTGIVIFGGAINSSPSSSSNQPSFTMTSDLYIFDMPTGYWKKLVNSGGRGPKERAAHAGATVRDNQVLYYGGSTGNGQFASDDLLLLNLEKEVNWIKVPIEGITPGPRYGHSLSFSYPILFLFGGCCYISSSKKSMLANDLWVFQTDIKPFRWIKVEIRGNFFPSPRLYHTSNIISKNKGESDTIVIFGGRDSQNASLNDISLLSRVTSGAQEYFQWIQVRANPSAKIKEVISRHQHSSIIFGPFLFIIGGRTSQSFQATFDIFSFVSYTWHNFGKIGFFRHTAWIYFNEEKIFNGGLYLYIYGGFEINGPNSVMNSKFLRINIIKLFSKNEILNKELNDYLNSITRNSDEKNNAKNYFKLSSKVVVYNIPEQEQNNFGALLQEIPYAELSEVDKKIRELPLTMPKKKDYNLNLVSLFLQLLPNPEQKNIYLKKQDKIVILKREYILELIDDCKRQLIGSSPLINVKSPVKIFGSIYGQYNDLVRYFTLFGRPSELKGDIEGVDYLFLGNFTNRGAFSIEVLCLLIALKVKYKEKFHILRGSLEDMEMSKYYGLAEECKEKFGEDIDSPNSVFQHICNLFDFLPLVAVINNQIICLHSGIGNNFTNLSQINSIKLPCKVKDNPILQDILWNTPELLDKSKEEYNYNNITTKYRKNHFNEKMVKAFLNKNRMTMLIRSHDICELGINESYNKNIITITSATNYCGIYQNSGAILFINKSYKIQPKILVIEEGLSIWQNQNWSKTEYPPSPKRNFKI